MRARRSRSSTSEPIRIDSFSILPTSSLVFSSPVTAPWRCNSAKPRIAVSGVRNSCEASATNRRSLDSEAFFCAKDSSMRPNMMLSDCVRRPTSVDGLNSGRRADKSPSAIAAAVTSTSNNGCRLIPINQRETKPMTMSTAMLISKKSQLSSCSVLSTLESETATTTDPKSDGNTKASARVSESGFDV